MRCLPLSCVLALTLPLAAACDHQPAAGAAVVSERTATAPPADTGAATPMPHGDHQPHYGGVVYMHGEMHFEVVLDRNGRHRVYFSDAVRADLPAAVASSVTLTISRPGWSPESITASIDEQGEGWRADGAPVGAGEATARVAFVVKNGVMDGASTSVATGDTKAGNDDSYWIDVPFLPPGKPAS